MSTQLHITTGLFNPEGIVCLLRDTYGDTYPEASVRSGDALREHMAGGGERYFITVLTDTVVGCVSSRVLSVTEDPSTHEHFAEIGKLCTATHLKRRSQVAHDLCATAIADSESEGARAWYATVRSGAALRVAEGLGFVPVGYTEEHVVGGAREQHVIVVRSSPRLTARRVVPSNWDAADSPYRSRLVQAAGNALGLPPARVAEYPDQIFVIEPSCRTENASFQAIPSERRLRLAGLPKQAANYLDAVVLSHRVREISELQSRGWRLMAFLPAWYELRFDCVLMSISDDVARKPDAALRRHVAAYERLAAEGASHV